MCPSLKYAHRVALVLVQQQQQKQQVQVGVRAVTSNSSRVQINRRTWMHRKWRNKQRCCLICVYGVSSRLLSITLCLVQRFILMCVLTEQLYVLSDSVTQTD